MIAPQIAAIAATLLQIISGLEWPLYAARKAEMANRNPMKMVRGQSPSKYEALTEGSAAG